ncbi:MAG: hypothetical protein M1822_006469 [Bathelium mastoideum]|nr:MAG: hypothetical protein M1822_006469 [Bathelium mastoideum]
MLQTQAEIQPSGNANFGPSFPSWHYNSSTKSLRDESSEVFRRAPIDPPRHKLDNEDDVEDQNEVSIGCGPVKESIQNIPRTNEEQALDNVPILYRSSPNPGASQLSTDTQSSLSNAQYRCSPGTSVEPASQDRLAIREVNLKAIVQGTKPEHAEYFGTLVDEMPITKLKMWNVVGSLSRTWTDSIQPKLCNLLQHNWHRLLRHQPATGAPVYALRAYLVGWSKGHAAPHVALLSSQNFESFSRNARKIVLKHGLLNSHGWGPSFVSLRLQTGIIQPMSPLRTSPPVEHQEFGDDLPLDLSQNAHYRKLGELHSRHCNPTADRSSTLLEPEEDWLIYILGDANVNGICGTKFRTSRGSSGTIGGTLAVDHEYYGLTAAHTFGKTESLEKILEVEEHDMSDISDISDSFFEYDAEDLDLINDISSKYGCQLRLDELLVPSLTEDYEMSDVSNDISDYNNQDVAPKKDVPLEYQGRSFGVLGAGEQVSQAFEDR